MDDITMQKPSIAVLRAERVMVMAEPIAVVRTAAGAGESVGPIRSPMLTCGIPPNRLEGLARIESRNVFS